MTIWAIFISAYLVGFSGALVPGPLLTVTVNESFRRGFRAGPQLITGHALLEVVIVVLIASGLYRLIHNNLVYGIIALFGGLFLAWMGWQMFTGAVKKRVRLDLDASHGNSHLGPLSLGALTSLANPYFIMWWLTVGAVYVAVASNHGIFGLAVFTVGHVLADYTWYSLISAAVGGGRRFFNQSVYRAVVFCCGIFLLVLGFYFIKSGISFWQGWQSSMQAVFLHMKEAL